jgi:hypothetical protein
MEITVIDEPIEGTTLPSWIENAFNDPLNLPWTPLYRERALFRHRACAFE